MATSVSAHTMPSSIDLINKLQLGFSCFLLNLVGSISTNVQPPRQLNFNSNPRIFIINLCITTYQEAWCCWSSLDTVPLRPMIKFKHSVCNLLYPVLPIFHRWIVVRLAEVLLGFTSLKMTIFYF